MKNRHQPINETKAEVIYYSNLGVPMLHEEAEKTTSDIKKAVCMTLENFEEYIAAEDRLTYLRANWYI